MKRGVTCTKPIYYPTPNLRLKSYQKIFCTKLTKTMAEEEEETAEVSNIPPMEEVCAVYGSNPSGDKEGNHYRFALTNTEDGSKFEFSHKTCFLPSATAPFAGTWVSNTSVFKGTWSIAELEPETKPVGEENKRGRENGNC